MSAGNRRYIHPVQKELTVTMAAHMSSAEIAGQASKELSIYCILSCIMLRRKKNDNYYAVCNALSFAVPDLVIIAIQVGRVIERVKTGDVDICRAIPRRARGSGGNQSVDKERHGNGADVAHRSRPAEMSLFSA
ncbi:hypothetical protein FIBSPDRAFT_900977 [Athelia psychrophila]|uniref:Uncharacterized protein n=1 Tax=Athelia psychrophila TaxID=1759441 RepID=A0A165XRN2_9AGAM|nr:hypothetical protein FIBSPDRAFT_900977 [Fibularhizoctonia sp. CBS 109695]